MKNIFEDKFKKEQGQVAETTKSIIIPEAKVIVVAPLRQPVLMIVVGKRYIGKTYTNKKIEKLYLKGNPALGINGRKVIYFDVNGERTDLLAIPIDHAFDPSMPNWILAFSSPRAKVEARRVLPIKQDGTPMTIEELNVALEYVLNNFKGGLLIVEDPTKYIADTPGRDLSGGLATLRHKNSDVIANYQWKSKALNPKIWGNVSYLRLHKTNDSFKKYQNRIQGQEEILYLAENLEKYCNKQLRLNATKKQLDNEKEIPIETFYCLVDFDSTKIRGAFSPNDFYKAIEMYITQNKKVALAELEAETDLESGKPKYTFAQAYQIKRDELYREYYGN